MSILKGQHERGVVALNFAALLVSVGLEDGHLIVVWDWRTGQALSTVKGNGDRIFDVQFNPAGIRSLTSRFFPRQPLAIPSIPSRYLLANLSLSARYPLAFAILSPTFRANLSLSPRFPIAIPSLTR